MPATASAIVRPRCAVQEPGGASPWSPFLDYYYGGSSALAEVRAGRWSREAQLWAGLFRTDGIADDLARAMLDKRVSRADFEHALDGAEPTAPELVAFVDSARCLPAGLDLDAAIRGARVYHDLPTTVTTGHGVVAAFIFGAIYPNSALTLALNANIAAATDRRYMRTTKYVADLVADGGLPWKGEGCRSALRVRLVHGFVRVETGRHYPWKTEAYGEPINLTATHLTATVTGTWVVPHAERQGFRFTAREKDDIAAFTTLQAHYAGVPAEHLVFGYEDLSRLTMWAVHHGGVPEDDDYTSAQSVLQPLLRNGYPLTRSRLQTAAFNAMVVAYSRGMLGDALCERFGIPRSAAGRLIAGLNSAANRWLSRAHARRTEDSRYCVARRRWWREHIPMMLEQTTGSSRTDYAHSAQAR